ncbi:hypothetical protein [Bogoriella caseilytica]|uniref:Uncharacterized protein n=1 Tax=Bogoriella caseilytica TaxID=56055 RepID=A0A3N2BEC1_9MICO|nr:hypothetical protein [Bogoriella caseilytica]ROR73613.1 hypothetical protein EDD31_2000 [Bogoriella caseilytica]
MEPAPRLSPGARWIPDVRGHGRGVVVSARPEAGLMTISVWRENVCTATLRLEPDDAAALISALADGLVDLDAPAELRRPA